MTEEIRAEFGWFVLHQYYRLDRRRWDRLSDKKKERCGRDFADTLRLFCQAPDRQGNCYSVWGDKGDLAVMLVDPDLNHLNESEYRLLDSMPPGVLQPCHSFVSVTETSEYMTQEKDYDRVLQEKEGLSPESDEYRQKMGSFKKRMQDYVDERLYPILPEHKVMCFYPMNKLRSGGQNWYTLDFNRRKQLMAGHMMTGRKFAGKVRQLVTGAVGLDAWEWGVTLFADDPSYFKQILYEMRFDEVSAVYGQFGDFIVSLRQEPEDLLARIVPK